MAHPPIFFIVLSSNPGEFLSRSMKNSERPSDGLATLSAVAVRASSTILVATWAEDIQLGFLKLASYHKEYVMTTVAANTLLLCCITVRIW